MGTGLGDALVDGRWTGLRFSRMGSPHPHFRHFCPICCSQMPRHRMSSSARLFHVRETWAARQRDVASRYPRILRQTSRGSIAKGSMRMRCDSCSVSKDSCEKQHIVRSPCRMRARRRCGEEEKLDHMTETASRSATGSASRACVAGRQEHQYRSNRGHRRPRRVVGARHWQKECLRDARLFGARSEEAGGGRMTRPATSIATSVREGMGEQQCQ